MHIATALVASAALVACAPPATLPGTPANAAPSTINRDDLELIPATASAVFHVDATALRASPVYTDWLAPQLASSHELARIASACGFDPVAQVTSLTFAAMGGMADDGASELIIHGISSDRLAACLPKLATASAAIRQDRDTWLVTSANRPLAIRFVGDRVAVVAMGPASREALDALLGQASFATSARFTDIHAKLHGAAIWFALTPPAILNLIPLMEVHAALGSVDLGDTITVHATMQFDTPDGAQRAATKFKADFTQLASLATPVDVAVTASQLAVTARIGHHQVVSLLADVQLGL